MVSRVLFISRVFFCLVMVSGVLFVLIGFQSVAFAVYFSFSNLSFVLG